MKKSKYAPRVPARGERNGNARLCREKIGMIREERGLYGTSYEKIAYMFGVSKRQAQRICKKTSWEHIE